MPLLPGNETITFTHYDRTNQTVGKYGVLTAGEETQTIGGCSLDPVSEKDNIADTTYSEATNVCITPQTWFTGTLRAEDLIVDADQVSYRIIGVRQYKDAQGRKDHVTFYCKYEDG